MYGSGANLEKWVWFFSNGGVTEMKRCGFLIFFFLFLFQFLNFIFLPLGGGKWRIHGFIFDLIYLFCALLKLQK